MNRAIRSQSRVNSGRIPGLFTFVILVIQQNLIDQTVDGSLTINP